MFVYLIVAPRDCDVVEFPDGRRRVTTRGAGAALADSAPEAPLSAAASEERVARHQAAHREWAERLDRALDDSTSIAHARMIRERFAAENPEPQLDGQDAVTASRARVTEGRWWCARVDHPEAGFELWLADAEDDYPLTGVAEALTELVARGWDLRHVAEEKQVVHEDASSRAVLVSARFLLQRNGSATDDQRPS